MFGLGTFTTGAEPFPGLVVHGQVLDLRPALGAATTTGTLLQSWDTTLVRLRELAAADGPRIPLTQLRPLPPVQPPGQILCAGANYFRHLQQIVVSTLRNSGDPRPDDELRAEAAEQTRRRSEAGRPFLFAGLVSALSGARDDIVLWGPGVEHDWELELAVVIGRPAHRVSAADAMEHVAGYTISNDVSTRDVMRGPGPMTDFVTSKNRPTFFPTGPYLVPREFVPDPRALRITLSVNGEVMQDESVDDIIYGVEEIVSHASHLTRLSPGDLILTGSPAGNAGHHGNRWLRPGDLVEAEITGLGSQRNRCVAAPA